MGTGSDGTRQDTLHSINAMDRHTYSSSSQLKYPRQFLAAAGRSTFAAFPIARRLLVRDLHARYRQAALGFVWILLPALAQTAIWLFLSASNIVNSGETHIPYVVFVIIGTLLWQSFAEMLMSPGNQILNSVQMMTRLNFPHEALFLAGLADGAVSLSARVVVFLPIGLLYHVEMGWGLLFAPIGGVALLVLGFAIGLVLTPFSLLYQDLSRLLLIVTGFWLLVTPVAYATPTTGPGVLIAKLNPVTPVLNQTRSWLTGGALLPSKEFIVISIISTILLVFGWLLFRLAKPHLIDRFGA